MNSPHDDQLRAEYGDVSLYSGKVDPDNPTFSSLLGALKAVHTGEMGMDVLSRYHQSLSAQLQNSRKTIENMPVPDEFKDIARDQRNISIGSLDIVQLMLDELSAYIREPTEENMAACVSSLLNSQRIMKDVNDMLDEHIRLADTE